MAAETREGRVGLAGLPWVTLVVAALLGGGAVWMHASSKQAVVEFEERRADVRQYFDEHLYLALDRDLEGLLEGSQFERQRIYLLEAKDTGLSHISESRTRSEQSRIANLVTKAMVARAQLPTSRYGVSSTRGSPLHLLAHAAAHETGLALCLTLIVLLAVGMAIENAWGHILFAFFCGASTAGLAWVRALSAPPAELPWAGSSGLAVALLGAYMALTLRGHARYYGGLVSGWLLLLIWPASQYALIHHLWEPGFDRSLFFIHSVGVGAGFAVASLVAALGLERRADGSAKPQPSAAASALGMARQARHGGQEGRAFSVLKAEAERLPGNAEVVAALWELAKELGQEAEAAPVVVDLAKRALRERRSADAAKLWMDLVTQGVWPNVDPLILVCMGEALLDEGHPTEALAAMRRAAESAEPIVSALALRIVKVARDLDPDLTCMSAKLALADPRLPEAQREDLWTLASAAASAIGEAPENGPAEEDSAGVAETPQRPAAETESPDSPSGLESPTDPQLADDFADIEGLDSGALSGDTLAEFFEASEEGATVDADEIASWNDPGVVGDLTAEAGVVEEDSTDTLALVLPPSEIDGSFDDDDDDLDAKWQDVQAIVDTAVQYDTPTCTLKVVPVIPIALGGRGLMLEIEGQGKTSLEYERIEAIAVGAVGGVSEGAVVVVDLILNWTSCGDGDLRILRVRSDAFDPRQIAPAALPLDSLKAILAELLARTTATPLPCREGALGNALARFESLSSYEAEVLGADPFDF